MRGANRHLAFLALVLTLAYGAAVDAQLIIRNTEPYRNYAYEGYRPYESLVFGRDRTPQFDNMGQFVMNGVNVFELQEFRTLQTTPGSIIGKERQYGDFLNRLVIANDSYKGVDTRLIVGDRIRTKFTPLTLDLAAMNGLRVDSNFKDASLVLAVSRVDRPIFEAIRNADFVVHGREGSQFRPSWSTYLLGADLRTKRPGLDLGVSWVNQYRTDSFKTLGENSFKGTLPHHRGSPPCGWCCAWPTKTLTTPSACGSAGRLSCSMAAAWRTCPDPTTNSTRVSCGSQSPNTRTARSFRRFSAIRATT